MGSTMPRRTIYVTDYDRVVRQGRSQGTGPAYHPGLEVRDTASIATSTRIWSDKFGRVIHLLSHGELEAFLQFEWLPTVVDLREQFFLDPADTQAICKELSLIHPGVKGKPIVMTTDFVVTRRKDGREWIEAYQVKRRESDLTPRMRAKLKVESLYWERRNVRWCVLYSEEFNDLFCRNQKLLRSWRLTTLAAADFRRMLAVLRAARRQCPEEAAADIPLSKIKMTNGDLLSFSQCLKVLCAWQVVQFPIKELAFAECPMKFFSETHHAA